MSTDSFAVSVTVNDIAYDAPCAPGEAARVRDMAQRLDQRVRALALALGDKPQSELLLLAALTLEDEHDAARAELERYRAGAAHDGKALHADQILAQRLLSAAERIAAISEKLDAA